MNKKRIKFRIMRLYNKNSKKKKKTLLNAYALKKFKIYQNFIICELKEN